VHPRVRVAVLSTGDELVEPGTEAAYGQISDANSYTLWGNLAEARCGPPPSRYRRRRRGQATGGHRWRALAEADVFITSGGVSVGQRDVVKRILEGLGTIERYKVAMQPGAPQAFGLVEGKPFFGLPGNPVSVFVSFELFIRPALLKMMRTASVQPPRDHGGAGGGRRRPTEEGPVRPGARGWDPGAWRARPTGGAASHLLATVSRANGLAIIPGRHRRWRRRVTRSP